MRRISLLLLVVLLAGCKSTIGPLASKQREQKPDPLYNSEQQQRWARERYSYTEDAPLLTPRSASEPYGSVGR